jgi:hypothetical protein
MPDPISSAAAGAAGEAAKGLAVPVYQDAVQPAAREIGKALQTVAKTIHIALAPVAGLVWGYDRITEYLDRRLTEKLAGTPEERIVTPPSNVAGPALEALRFAGSEEDLREMYASLLATAMDSATMSAAHPAFVEAIKQLTPDEARILRHLADGQHRPIINIRADSKDGSGGVDVGRYLTMLDEEAALIHPELTAGYLDNLIRLGLIEIPVGFHLARPGAYDELENHPNVKAVRQRIDDIEGQTCIIVRTLVRFTSLGDQFIAACVREREGEIPRSGT